MLLAIDVGNTNSKFAVFDDDEIVAQWRLRTEAKRTADEYAAWLTQLMMTGKLVSLPWVTRVAGWATTMPAFLSAISARNRPMPAAIAILSDIGMALTIHSRIGSTLMMKKMTPEMKTQPSATCQL